MKARFGVFTSLTLAYTFLAVTFSGVVLWFTPRGRIAIPSGWEFLGISKAGWVEVHDGFVVVFAVAAVLHTFLFNWNAILGYVRQRTDGTVRCRYRVEIIATTILFILTFAGIVSHIPPATSLTGLRDQIKDSYETGTHWAGVPAGTPRHERRSDHDAAVPHEHTRGSRREDRTRGFGEMTIAQAATRAGVDTATARQRLSAAGIVVTDCSQTLGVIAEQHGTRSGRIMRTIAGYSARRGEGRSQRRRSGW
jgi:hypothetical protein